jgi:hypothetical protein
LIEIPGPAGAGYALSLSYHSDTNPEEAGSWVGYGWDYQRLTFTCHPSLSPLQPECRSVEFSYLQRAVESRHCVSQRRPTSYADTADAFVLFAPSLNPHISELADMAHHSQSLQLSGGQPYVMRPVDTLTLTMYQSGTWSEDARCVAVP